MQKYRGLEKFITYMECGKLLEEPRKLSGGLMHTMYAVVTDTGKYAVKELNESIMSRKEALTNFINSEIISEELSKLVPAVIAIKVNNEAIINIDGTYYMLFPWHEGDSISTNKITVDHCKKIGEILGKIHSAKLYIKDLEHKEFEDEIYDWNNYLFEGKNKEVTWSLDLEKNIKKIYEWNEMSNFSSKELQSLHVISHRDLDPKNVMWENNEPYLIDWEAAGLVNPYSELLEVINYWAINETGEVDEKKLVGILDSYRKKIEIINVNWSLIISSGFSSMLGWLNYNMRRSLGIESSLESERELGTEQVVLTLEELNKYEEKTKELKSLLEKYVHD